MTDKKRALKHISRWAVVPVVALGVGVTAVESGWGEPSTNSKSATPVTQAGAGVRQQDSPARPVLPPVGGPEGERRDSPARPVLPPVGERPSDAHHVEPRSPRHGHGHTAPNSNPDIRTVELNLDTDEQRSDRAFAQAYDRMLNAMRANAGPSYRRDVRQTTTERNRFLRLRITPAGGTPVDLYYTADNLYLRGYATHHDEHNPVLYELGRGQDNDQLNLGDAIRWNPHDVVRTHIPEDYPGLRNRGADPMSEIRLGRGDLLTDINMLNTTQRTQFGPDRPAQAPTTADLSQSLVRVIVATAEAVRFPTISADIDGALRAGRTTRLDLENQELVNHWNVLSQYVVDVTNNTNTPPRRIAPHIPELHNFREAQSRIAILHTPK